MHLIVRTLLLSSAWAAIQEYWNNPEFPSEMIPYVLHTKELHCPNSNATVLITLDKNVENLAADLVKAVSGSLVIGNESFLFEKSIPNVDCGIILVNDVVSRFVDDCFFLNKINYSTDYSTRIRLDKLQGTRVSACQ